ncbi:unnamed protein product [Calicophoron daubneyi]|uniref:ABC transporter domain-containing protein n=1 Tax=Calicophoron daubneyi TaxID=300641 RepID=A0AAV2T5G9_CALDB
MRRVLLVHFIRGPTILFAFILASMITLSSIFWPTVGLLVISDKENSLDGYLPVKEKFPDMEDNWLIGYEFLEEDKELIKKLEGVAHRLLNYMVRGSKSDSSAHWCGKIEDCARIVYQGIDPSRSSVLYPTNTYYLFLVRRLSKSKEAGGEDIFGYNSVAPFGTFHSPEVAIELYLPMKAKVDEFFMKEHTPKGKQPIKTRLKMGVTAIEREPLLESIIKQGKEKTGKVFLITVMAIHQYLASACLIVCVGSIMVSDKETGFRSLMSLMGMRRVSYMTAHFIVAEGLVVIIALIGTLIHVTVAEQLTDKKLSAFDYVYIFLSNIVNTWHQCGLALAMCSFSRSTRAVMFPLLALFASSVVVELLMVKEMIEKLQKNEFSSPLDDHGYIFPSFAYSSIHAQILTGKTFTLKDERIGFYFGMQILIAVCCIIFGVYLDCVIESGTGHKFSFDFPIVFLRMICNRLCGKKVPERRSSMLKRRHVVSTVHRMVEEAKQEFTRVWMKQVTKVYTRWRGIKKSYFRAVSKVDLCLQKGEITAILGHNGAGKTTIFNILTGLSPATSGYIRIFGQNPLDAWDAIRLRRITGVCTQFDVLDEKMTAFEHMRLMGAIKGLGRTGIALDTAKLFSKLELDFYIDTATHIMPGGDKRKLSVAMALIGGPRLILLDEPTSGVDPLSRRCIWRALRDFRPNRVIVLITHYMDEADVLADRKAIMIGGKLICYGTSKFLKDNYYPGYLLHVTCMKMSRTEARVQKYLTQLEGVTFLRAFNEQMTFFVEQDAVDSVSRRLFSPSGQEELQICCVTSLGFAVTTLEEIFLKLDEQPYEDEADKASEASQKPVPGTVKSWLLKGLLTVRSMLEGYSPTAMMSRDEDLLPAHPRSEFRIGFRQFGLFLRVLLGLLVLPTPVHILLRTLLPVFGVAASAVIYYLEKSNRIRLEKYEFVNRVGITSVRQHISIAKTESKSIDDSVYREDLQCIRTQLGPLEPYVTEIKFDGSTKYSVDLGKSNPVFKRYGSTRIDINKWNKDEIDVTVILGTHDHDLTHQIMLHHFLASNCIHKRNLIKQGKMKNGSATVHWIGDLASWESMWPEVHPQLQLGTACISMMACGIFNCILNPLIAGDIVRDKELMVVAQLELYGMRHWAYWGAHYCTHIFQYLLLACFTTIIMFPFPKHILRSWQSIILHNWISFLSAVDNICMIYVCCLFFKRVSGAVVLFGSTILIAVFVYITVFFIPLSMLEAAYGAILFIFPFTDPYLALMLTDFRIRVEKVFLFGDTDAEYVPSLWRQLWYSHSRISQIIHLTRILILGLFFIGANFYLFHVKRKKEDDKYRKMINRISSADEINFELLPTGVRKSARNVVAYVRRKSSGMETDDDTVAFVYNLRKTYFLGSLSIFSRFFQSCSTNKKVRATNSHVAIADTSFLVKSGEIFGVLGPSGAGKSTLLDCLATKLQSDFGQVGIVSNHTNKLISSHAAAKCGAIGYCPQHNPIWPQLTVREHLVVYSVMRDVNEDMIGYHVTKLIRQVNLQSYTNTYAGALSGGCKRRLSMAISMVGDPSLIIMDEPSCGVDPRSRRNLWKTLLNCARATDRGCVISTHFIDEGESLCDQLAILVDGCTLAIGTPYKLKRSCGQGFYVEIKITRDYSLMPDEADFAAQHSVEKFIHEIEGLFPVAHVVDHFEERVSFRFPTEDFEQFRIVFIYLLTAHRGGVIEDFTVCSPTLEQVYFDLAKSQLHSP